MPLPHLQLSNDVLVSLQIADELHFRMPEIRKSLELHGRKDKPPTQDLMVDSNEFKAVRQFVMLD